MNQRITTPTLASPLLYLKGMGPHRAELLKKELSLVSYGDLLEYFPFRYIDRSQVYPIASIDPSNVSFIQIRARVLGIGSTGTGFKERLTVEVTDFSGLGEMVWFRYTKSIAQKIKVGSEYIFFGRAAFYNNRLQIVHPEFEPATSSTTTPKIKVHGVYSSTEALNKAGVNMKLISSAVRSIFEQIPPAYIPETLPQYLVESLSLMSRGEALYQAHFPQSHEALNRAIFRLKFEELLALQLNLIQTKNRRHNSSQGQIFEKVGKYFESFYKELSFPLTGAQQRVIKEIRADMRSGHQMNRLLQGDVGSGKTIVALLCALIALDSGFQSTIMAPTEILARQHYQSIIEMCQQSEASSGVRVRVEILTGTTRARERRVLLEDLKNGDIDILIGTHALIEEPVEFHNLGFAVIDEQHRFGVKQRAALWQKNTIPPHVLVMTATPIPRTLAMTLYGDLDVSVIDELPPGRKPIETYAFKEAERLRVAGFMREQIALGRQVYVVYPLIKESEKLDYANLERGAENITEFFPHPQYSNVVVHGKLAPEQKEFGMKMFKDGDADILISTTVIEVGVNVPNATVMVIESAERFGISQLHQLRGRVGRSSHQSYCLLVTGDNISKDSQKRIEAMCSTNDGFKLAQMDLEIRGGGDIEGTRQSGQAVELKVANLSKDSEILEFAATQAELILKGDIGLSHPLNAPLRELIKTFTEGLGSFTFSQIS